MGKSGGSAPAAPQLSQEEKDLYKKQGQILDQINSIYGTSVKDFTEASDVLKRASGIYTTNADGTLSLDQGAIAKQTELNKLNMDRYERALKGTLPVSEGLSQKQADDFKLLKENAARRGINITGESPEEATSDSTAGAALLGNFNKTYGLLADSERQYQLSNNTNSSLSLLGGSQAAGPASLIGSGNNLASSYGQAAAPYANQRMLQYQAQLGQYGYDQQAKSGILGSGLAGAGIGASVGGTTGALIGGGAGVVAGLLGR